MSTGKKPSVYKELTSFGSLGIELVVAVLIGSGVGYQLDKWLGTRPWLMVIGAIFGAAAGFRDAYRLIVKTDWDGDNDNDKDKD